MNKKGQILVYLGQIKDESPPKPHENLKFLECENTNKTSKRALRVITECTFFEYVHKYQTQLYISRNPPPPPKKKL